MSIETKLKKEIKKFCIGQGLSLALRGKQYIDEFNCLHPEAASHEVQGQLIRCLAFNYLERAIRSEMPHYSNDCSIKDIEEWYLDELQKFVRKSFKKFKKEWLK